MRRLSKNGIRNRFEPDRGATIVVGNVPGWYPDMEGNEDGRRAGVRMHNN